MAPPDSRKQTLLRSVPWPWLLREAARFPIPLSSPARPARPIFSGPPIRRARRGRFRFARAFPGWRANPRARFPAAEDFLFEIAQLSRRFSCALLQTIFPRPAPAVRSIRFLRVPFHEVFLELPGFHFPTSPFAPQSLRTRAPAARVPSSPPGFPDCSAARAFQETPHVPDLAASDAAPAGPAQRLRQSSPPAKTDAQ